MASSTPSIRQRAYQSLSLYLPALLMGLLALASWWLVRKNPPPAPVAAQDDSRRIVDYEMRDFSTVSYDAAGAPGNMIAGASMQHYSTGEMLIQAPRLQRRSADGSMVRAEANTALSNDDASDVTLKGNAQIERSASGEQAAMQLRGEHLRITDKGQKITSPQAVAISHGKIRFDAGSMQYNAKTKVLELGNGVRGQISP